jgi:hypothetical protein
MSEITRRQALTQLATAFVAAGTIDRLAAEDLHQVVQQAVVAGPYMPRSLSPEQFRALERLTDLILPVDGDKPGAIQAGVPAWIDSLLNVNAELKNRYVTGLGWLDATMTARHGTNWASSTPEHQRALLDQIAFQRNRSPELNPGVDFFILARRMTVDGYYTSPIGRRTIYFGDLGVNEYVMPQEAVDYVLSRSPFN